MRPSRGLRTGGWDRTGFRRPGCARGGSLEPARRAGAARAGARGLPSCGSAAALSGWLSYLTQRYRSRKKWNVTHFISPRADRMGGHGGENMTLFRRIRVLALLLPAFGCASPLRDIPEGRPDAGIAQKFKKVDAVLEEMIAARKLAGAIVLAAKDGQVVFNGVYGKMDLEAGTPMQPDALFRIYSMTKAIVSAAALVLVDDGKLKLDAPIGESIPELRDLKVGTGDGSRAAARPPTVKDLMLHTAGFLYGNADRPGGKLYQEKKPLEAPNLDEMAKRLATIPLAFDPGKDWVYSLSIDVLGLVIERVSGTTLDKFLEERIFRPLDMKDTGFFVPAEKAARFAANYQRQEKDLRRIDTPSKYLKPPGLLSGGGGLVSTARDYLRFLLMVEAGGQLHGR